jgi:putative transposase
LAVATGIAASTIYRKLARCGKFLLPLKDCIEKSTFAEKIVKHQRALSDEERLNILEAMRSDKYVDKSPRAIFYMLLDKGTFLCSISTMYRLLRSVGEVQERRKQARSKSFATPELLATQTNDVWTWDITKLRGQRKWEYFYLYVVMDIFSRKIVGHAVYNQELGTLAKEVISRAIDDEQLVERTPTIHSDRGAPMRSKVLSEFFSDLGISKSFSRPQVSNDNPFSEAGFRTLKYMPNFPDRFGTIQESREFMSKFVYWYNNEHMHSGIGFYTPQSVHCGKANEIKYFRDKILAR